MDVISLIIILAPLLLALYIAITSLASKKFRRARNEEHCAIPGGQLEGRVKSIKSQTGAILAVTYLVLVVLATNIRFTRSGEDSIAMGIIGLLFLPEILVFEMLDIHVESDSGRMVLIIGSAILNAIMIYFTVVFLKRILN
jgi:hypothetical protein